MTVEEVFREKSLFGCSTKYQTWYFFLIDLLGDQATVVFVTPQTMLGPSGQPGICQWFFKSFLTTYPASEHHAWSPSYWDFNWALALSRALPIKLSLVDISICHFYQEIGLKLRKFWTQYSCKIDNKMSFIIISKHISLLIVHFIGCKLEKLYEFELSCLPIMETWTAQCTPHYCWWCRYMSYGWV